MSAVRGPVICFRFRGLSRIVHRRCSPVAVRIIDRTTPTMSQLPDVLTSLTAGDEVRATDTTHQTPVVPQAPALVPAPSTVGVATGACALPALADPSTGPDGLSALPAPAQLPSASRINAETAQQGNAAASSSQQRQSLGGTPSPRANVFDDMSGQFAPSGECWDDFIARLRREHGGACGMFFLPRFFL